MAVNDWPVPCNSGALQADSRAQHSSTHRAQVDPLVLLPVPDELQPVAHIPWTLHISHPLLQRPRQAQGGGHFGGCPLALVQVQGEGDALRPQLLHVGKPAG